MNIDLNAIEARAKAATRGKWKAKTNRHPECSGEDWGWIDGPVENWCWTDRRAHSRADAEFIANAHQDIPALLAEVERQAAEIASVTAERDALKEATTDAWLQLRTATFSTDKGAADLAKFILSILPEAPKEDANG